MLAYSVIPATNIDKSVEWLHFEVQHQREDYAGLFFNNRPVLNLKKTDHELGNAIQRGQGE